MAGSVRIQLLNLLKEDSKTPIILSKAIGVHLSSVSRALSALEKKGLVKCLTPKVNHPRFYGITEKGKEVQDEIKKLLV